MNKKVPLFVFENFSIKKVKNIDVDGMLGKRRR